MSRGIPLGADDQLAILLQQDEFNEFANSEAVLVESAVMDERGRITIPLPVRERTGDEEYAVVLSADGIIHLVPGSVIRSMWVEADLSE